MKNLKQEIVEELTECITQLKNTNFLFIPNFEKVMVKLELFQEQIKDEKIEQLMLILKGNMYSCSYPETKVNESWIINFAKLLQLVKEININK